MVVAKQASHWDYFHLLGSFDEKRKFNYAVRLYVLFVNPESGDVARKYILTRVIQALGAVSNSMRAGAFSLLCTILANSPDMVDYETVKKIVNDHLKPAVNMKADPESYVGQLLAYKALVQSKFLEKTPTLLNEIADNLMELSTKKSYLHAESLRLLSQITATTKQEFGSDEFLRHLKDLNTQTLEKLEYLLVLDQNVDESETLNYLFDGRRLLSPQTAQELGILLAKCHDPSHEFYTRFSEAVADNPKFVSKMWKTYEAQIKDKLDTSKNSASEMYFTLVDEMLQQLVRKENFKSVRVIVSATVVESLLKHSKTRPELTKKVCKSISDVLEKAKDSALSLEMLNLLVINPGNFSLDEITGTKVIGSTWRSLGAQETKDFAAKCLNVVVKGEGVKNKDRMNALSMYCNLLDQYLDKHRKNPDNENADTNETDWIVGGLKTLLKAGLVDDETVSTELASAIRRSFFNSLSIKFPSLPAYADALKGLVKCLNTCLQKTLKIKVNEEMKQAWDLSQKLIPALAKSFKKVDDDKKLLINVLELLTSFIALKCIYEPKESQFNLTDLQSVLKRIKSGDNTDLEWIEVVMDLFLSMLSNKDATSRRIVNIVFKRMVSYMNEGAFMQLVDVLRPGYDLKSAEDVEEGSGGEEDDEDTSEESEDDEESETEGGEGKGDDEEDDDTDDDGTDEDDDMDDEDINSKSFNMEKLQFDLRKALTPTADSDNESINIDDLDEEQGRQLDATLSAIFKNAKVKKPKDKKETATTHFRARVLDLIEIYCLAGMPLDHWLTLIPATIELANNLVTAKNAGGLKPKLLTFLKNISSATISDIGKEDLNVKQLAEMLEQLIITAASATGTKKDLSEHFLALIKFCLRNANHVHTSKIGTMTESMNNVGIIAAECFFSDKSSLHPNLMKHLCTSNWLGVHNMMKTLVQRTLVKSTKPFKRLKGIELLTAYVKSDRLFSSISDADSKSLKKLFESVLNSLLELKSDEVFDLAILQAIVGLIFNLQKGKCSGSIQWKTWKQRVPELLSMDSGTFKTLKPPLMSLCTKLGLDANGLVTDDAKPIKKKQKQTNQPSQQGRNSRKRKQVDARKLKKESKMRRLAAMDGLENLSWSRLNTVD